MNHEEDVSSTEQKHNYICALENPTIVSFAVPKEALKRKRKMENQPENLTKKIQDLNKKNKVLSSRVKILEIQQARDKNKSHALEGIVMLEKAAKQL